MNRNVVFVVLFCVLLGGLVGGGVLVYRSGVEESNREFLRKSYNIHLDLLQQVMINMYEKNSGSFAWVKEGDGDIASMIPMEQRKLFPEEFASLSPNPEKYVNFGETPDGKKIKLRKDAAGIVIFIADESGGYEPRVEEYAPWSGSLVRKIL